MSTVITKAANPLQPVTQQSALLAIIARAAADPEVNIDKMERLLIMQQGIVDREAKVAFNDALNRAQAEMSPIANDASNPETRSRYASYAQLDRAVRPIYTRHGFALSFNEGVTDKPDHVRVLCKLTHRDGHTEPYQTDMPCDGKGMKGNPNMTKTHAVGAAKQYGKRYLLKDIFNLATGEGDTDGNMPKAEEEAKAPDDYDRWQADVRAIADEGTARLQDLWKRSPNDIRVFTVKFRMTWWEEMKAIAAKVRLEVA
jgi:hypothetical protein